MAKQPPKKNTPSTLRTRRCSTKVVRLDSVPHVFIPQAESVTLVPVDLGPPVWRAADPGVCPGTVHCCR